MIKEVFSFSENRRWGYSERCILLHKDPEFQALSLAQEILPFKNTGG